MSFRVLLGLVAVPAGAPGSSATGPGASAVRSPRPPLAMDRLQVQLLVHTHAVLAVLHRNRHKHIQYPGGDKLSRPRGQTELEFVHTLLGAAFSSEFRTLCLDLRH